MSKKNYLEEELETLIQTDPKAWLFIRQSSLDGVWYWDLENPDHEYMSPELWRLFGFDPAEKKHLVSEWQDLIHPEDLELAKQNLAAHLNDPSHPYDQIVRYKRADGGTVWVRCRGIAIRDESGKPIRLLGAHNDMTELMEEGSGAKRTSNLLTKIMNTTQSGIIAFDGNGQIASINSAGRHILGGYSGPTPFSWPDDITFFTDLSLDKLTTVDHPIRLSLSGVALAGQTFLMTRGDGEHQRYVRISSTPVGAEDHALSCVVIFDDVTDQERNRQKVERTGRLDALGQLTGGIAHDFNNLLATLQYAVQLARGAKSDAGREGYFETAMQSIDRGVELTQRLLAFAKQQPGLSKSLDIDEFLNNFSALTIPVVESNISLEFKANEDDLLVFCDPAQLENALLNLVLNARDAILRSGVGGRIVVKARSVGEIGATIAQEQEDERAYIAAGMLAERVSDSSRSDNTVYRYVEFSVSDDGPGMTDEVKSRAIDPFFTTKGVNSGTGLGLSMVYGFVQQSGGELRIYSEPEQGTTVRLILPRGTVDGAREDPVERPQKAHGNGETILIVEDEIALLMMMHDLMSSLGYELKTARSGADALKMIEAGETFDLLITDIVMPGSVTGFDLAREARDLRPDLPVLFMSGYTGYSKADMGEIDAPMLQKPSAPAELANAIARELSAAKTAQ